MAVRASRAGLVPAVGTVSGFLANYVLGIGVSQGCERKHFLQSVLEATFDDV